MCTQACFTAHIATLCIIWFWDKHGCDNYFGAKTITWRVDIDLALQVHSPTLRNDLFASNVLRLGAKAGVGHLPTMHKNKNCRGFPPCLRMI